MSADCIFCKIVRGEIPCTRLAETQDTLVFLDIGPIIKGHALVVPKAHYEQVLDAPAEVLDAVMRMAQRVARAQVNGLGAQGVNIIQNNGRAAGQLVPHLHVHVIPRYETDGHHWNWAAKRYESPEEMQRIADRLKASLG